MDKIKKILGGYPGFWNFYGVYIQIAVAIIAIFWVGIPKWIIDNWSTYALAIGSVILLPFLLIWISRLQGTFSKWLRLFIFSLARVEIFAIVGLVITVTFAGGFLRNLYYNYVDGDQAFLNVLFLDIVFIYFLALVASGKFKVEQPPALLIKQRGRAEVYLHQDSVIRHLPDPPTLVLFGYSFKEVVEVSEGEFLAYKQAPAIDSVAVARLVEGDDGGKWAIFNKDFRKRIPDLPTLEFMLRLGSRPIDKISWEELKRYKETDPLVSIFETR